MEINLPDITWKVISGYKQQIWNTCLFILQMALCWYDRTYVMLALNHFLHRDAQNINEVGMWLSYPSKGWSRDLSQRASLHKILKQKPKSVHP